MTDEEKIHLEKIKTFVENADYDSLDDVGKEVYDTAIILLKKLSKSP